MDLHAVDSADWGRPALDDARARVWRGPVGPVPRAPAALDEPRPIRAHAPLRISFVGGGTDLPQYYEAEGGAVLSSTIDRHAHVTLRPRRDDAIAIRSLDYRRTVYCRLDEEPRFDGALDLVKAAIRRVRGRTGFDLELRTEAPPGSGLGGSSAVTAALLGALAEHTGQALSRRQLAELNYTIERTDLGVAGGKQDQYATTFGGFNLIEFTKDRIAVMPVRLRRRSLADLADHLLLCHTGRLRPTLGLVETQVAYYRQKRPDTVDGMRRLHRMVYQMTEALLDGRLDAVGRLLHEAYVGKRMMNPHVSDGHIDRLYDLAREHGATGGKLCGAGGGGFILLFVERPARAAVRAALEAAGGRFADFAFAADGLRVHRGGQG
jgi:D-glycero-alpha-D-manno-heptose-7-phosphate kinase